MSAGPSVRNEAGDPGETTHGGGVTDARPAPLTATAALRQEAGWATLAFIITASVASLSSDGLSWGLALGGWLFTVAAFTAISVISDRLARRSNRGSVS